MMLRKLEESGNMNLSARTKYRKSVLVPRNFLQEVSRSRGFELVKTGCQCSILRGKC
jgi:hypothetical protein